MFMCPKDKEDLTIMQQYVMHLRYRLLDYQLEGVDPPEYLFNELKLAETLVEIDLKTQNS